MAAIIAVHGSFAHLEGTSDGVETTNALGPQWWQPDSAFGRHIHELIEAEGGDVEIVPLIWSGANSERDRRAAGMDLLALMGRLEARKQSYCVIGHSHGGSVISSALLEAAARRQQLPGLKRWITVGTPFVALRKERFLFTRLNLLQKAILVASAMLLFMLLVAVAGEVFDGRLGLGDDRRIVRFVIAAALMSVPFVLAYGVLRYLEARRLTRHRPRVRRRAREWFAGRWLALTHENDEAVQGLSALRGVHFHIFQRDFAVSGITLTSVFLLPVAYLLTVLSPSAMNGIADYMKTSYYMVEQYEAGEAATSSYRNDLRRLRRQARELRQKLEDPTVPFAQASELRSQLTKVRQSLRAARANLHAEHPDYAAYQRAQRFKRRFLQIDGKDCEGGRLCGRGRNIGVNSALLLHLITDEMAAALVDEDVRQSAFGNVLRFIVPILLVPVIFALIGVAFVMLVQAIAGAASAGLSRWLDQLTWSEIKRAALGNDTEAEIALEAGPHPDWIPDGVPFLPMEIAGRVTDHANAVTTQSLAKFRNAISDLAFAERRESETGVLTTYLTWQELIHTSYFEVPEFRMLLARAITQDGDVFRASPAFYTAQGYANAERWLAAVTREGTREAAVG